MRLISIEKSGPIKGICKQHGIWGNVKSDLTENCYYITPLVYLQKPKWMDNDVFKEIVKAIDLKLPVGFKLKHKREA